MVQSKEWLGQCNDNQMWLVSSIPDWLLSVSPNPRSGAVIGKKLVCNKAGNPILGASSQILQSLSLYWSQKQVKRMGGVSSCLAIVENWDPFLSYGCCLSTVTWIMKQDDTRTWHWPVWQKRKNHIITTCIVIPADQWLSMKLGQLHFNWLFPLKHYIGKSTHTLVARWKTAELLSDFCGDQMVFICCGALLG